MRALLWHLIVGKMRRQAGKSQLLCVNGRQLAGIYAEEVHLSASAQGNAYFVHELAR